MNFNTAIPRNALRLTMPRVKKSLSDSRGFLLVEGKAESELSHVVFRMHRVVELLTRDIVLPQINKWFPSLNNPRVSFLLLFSIPEVHGKLDVERLPVDLSTLGSNY